MLLHMLSGYNEFCIQVFLSTVLLIPYIVPTGNLVGNEIKHDVLVSSIASEGLQAPLQLVPCAVDLVSSTYHVVPYQLFIVHFAHIYSYSYNLYAERYYK